MPPGQALVRFARCQAPLDVRPHHLGDVLCNSLLAFVGLELSSLLVAIKMPTTTTIAICRRVDCLFLGFKNNILNKIRRQTTHERTRALTPSGGLMGAQSLADLSPEPSLVASPWDPSPGSRQSP